MKKNRGIYLQMEKFFLSLNVSCNPITEHTEHTQHDIYSDPTTSKKAVEVAIAEIAFGLHWYA